jgi:hypothetical protein
MHTFEFDVSSLEVDLFIQASKDFSKIHTDPHYAKLNGYADRVVHGAYFLLSALFRNPELLGERFTARADFFYPIVVNQKYVASYYAQEGPRIIFEVSKNEIVHLRITIEARQAIVNFPQNIEFDFESLLKKNLSKVSSSGHNQLIQAVFEMSRHVGTIKPGNNAILRRIEIVKGRESKLGKLVSTSESFKNQIHLREINYENGFIKSYSLARDFETIDAKNKWISFIAPQMTRKNEFAVVTGALGKLGLTSAILLSNLGFSVIGIIRSHDSISEAVISELATLDLRVKFQKLDEFIEDLSSIPNNKIKILVHCGSPKIKPNYEAFDHRYYLELRKVFTDQMEQLLTKLNSISHLVVPSTSYLDIESIPGYLEYVKAKESQEACAETFKEERQGLSLYMPRLAPFRSRHSQLTSANDDSVVQSFALGLSEFVGNVEL